MSPNTTTLALDEWFNFELPTGGQIEVRVKRIDVIGKGSITGEFVISWQDWEQVRAENLFHFDESDLSVSFESGIDVELNVFFRPPLARDLQETDADIRSRIQDIDDPLRKPESWYVRKIYQESGMIDDIGSVRTDYVGVSIETKWAEFFSPKSNSRSVLETVTGYLDRHDWPYKVIEDDLLLVKFGTELNQGGSWVVTAHIEELSNQCVLYSTHPKQIPEENRAEASISLMNANFKFDHGSFELDPRDGVIAFRTRVLPNAEPFEQALSTHLSGMSEMYNEISSYAGGGINDATTESGLTDTEGWYSIGNDQGSTKGPSNKSDSDTNEQN